MTGAKSKKRLIKYFRLMAVFSIAMVSILFLMCLFTPDNEVSEKEKRALSLFPEITLNRILSGEFSSDFEQYASDQMAARDFFVSVKSFFSTALGSDCSQDVYRGKDDYMIEKVNEPDYALIRETVSYMNAFTSHYGINTAFVLVPNASCILKDKLPAFAITADEEAISKEIEQMLSDDISYLWLYNTLSKAKDADFQIYYRTDHHWTSDAAYFCLNSVSAKLQHTPTDNFEKQTLTTKFTGSLSAKSGYTTNLYDSITAYIPTDVTVRVMNMSTLTITDTVFSTEGLNSSDPYTVFLGGNASRINIKTSAPGGKLLVFKDSYFNCFLPLLLNQYSEIDIVDPRYYYDDINLLMLEKNYSQVLFFYNLSTFIEDSSIKLIFSEFEEEIETKEPEKEEDNTQICEEETTVSQSTAEPATASEESTTPEPPEETTSSEDALNALIETLNASLDGEIPLLSDEQIAKIRGALSDTVIVGDSMAQMLLEYGYLDEAHVIYRRGYNLTQLSEIVAEAAALMPKNVIFFTGLNDANHFQSGDDAADYRAYMETYALRIRELRSYLPNVNIYVCSMLPPSDAFGATRPDLIRAPFFTIAITQMCEINDVHYIDTTWMVRQNLYLADGIHFNNSWTGVFVQYLAGVMEIDK